MDSELGFHQQLHQPQQNLHLFGYPFETGDPNTFPSFGNPYSVSDPMLNNVALFPISGLHHLRTCEPNSSRNWVDYVPHSHHASNEKLPTGPFDIGHPRSPAMGTAPARKRFLVFDQSGDKTTLICTSGVETPVQLGASWLPNPSTPHNLRNKNSQNGMYPLSSTLGDEKIDENTSRKILEDELHEDTEELDALLYSDSEFSEDDEETSTGHSPSTMTDNYMHNLIEETGEEVDSFTGPTKRQKLHNGGYNDKLSNTQTAILLKTRLSSTLEYDAESSCGNGSKWCKDESSSSHVGKRARKQRLRGTLSILQSIIPSAKGKVAVDVIDEAIHYLRSLKDEAKALGLDTL